MVNQVLSILLHKGHGKDPCSDRSYRTISNCTVLAKALDAYIGSLNVPLWVHLTPESPPKHINGVTCPGRFLVGGIGKL